MKQFIILIILFGISLLITSCLYDKADLPTLNNGCDTTYYTLSIKPIINNNCAIAGCHVVGGTGTGNFTTFASLKPYLDNGSVQIRINLDPSDLLYMPLGNTLDSADLATLNNWIASGYAGCD
ncbi:MAG: hypothetical protein LH629_14755 [Ignavibacteria bacterium]|nr:hypothetical protein [Ignavibacteria bacterium]